MRKPALRFVRREPPRPPEPGFWLVYLKRGARHVPARIWLCDHEPYNVENKLDRRQVGGGLAGLGSRMPDDREPAALARGRADRTAGWAHDRGRVRLPDVPA